MLGLPSWPSLTAAKLWYEAIARSLANALAILPARQLARKFSLRGVHEGTEK